MSQDAMQAQPAKQVEVVSGITVRLAGDSGDGMQLLGTQLTNTSALRLFPTFLLRFERRVEQELA